MGRIIKYARSVVVACDVQKIDTFKKLIGQTHFVSGIGGYKVGSILTIRYGLKRLVDVIRDFTDLPIIYDHQKAMTDIPYLGEKFAMAVKEVGADALIGFPHSGPATQEAWTRACRNAGLEVIIGGEMTHPKFRRSEGGYISDETIDEMYISAARLGVDNFVVPGTKAEKVSHYRSILEPLMQDEMTLYAPGFVAQGGAITDVAKVAGDSWHAIVGRAIYEAKDISKAAMEMTTNLL